MSEHHCLLNSKMMRNMYEKIHNTNSTDLSIIVAMDSDINRGNNEIRFQRNQ